MIEHEIATLTEVPHRVTIVCTCGKEISHPKEDGARARHFTHARIEASRDALKGEER